MITTTMRNYTDKELNWIVQEVLGATLPEASASIGIAKTFDPEAASFLSDPETQRVIQVVKAAHIATMRTINDHAHGSYVKALEKRFDEHHDWQAVEQEVKATLDRLQQHEAHFQGLRSSYRPAKPSRWERLNPYFAILASLLLAFVVFLAIALIWGSPTESQFQVTYDVSGMAQALLVGAAAVSVSITYALRSRGNDGR